MFWTLLRGRILLPRRVRRHSRWNSAGDLMALFRWGWLGRELPRSRMSLWKGKRDIKRDTATQMSSLPQRLRISSINISVFSSLVVSYWYPITWISISCFMGRIPPYGDTVLYTPQSSHRNSTHLNRTHKHRQLHEQPIRIRWIGQPLFLLPLQSLHK